jgi:outer membrane receptor protein involved in Fe transport
VFTDANGNTFNRAIVYPGRRNVEGGGRNDDLEHQAFRIVGGVRGDLARGLSYDASYQYGRTTLAETYQNDFSVTRLNRALYVVADPVTGLPVCNSVLDGTDVNCVPYDILVQNGVTPEALDYLQTPGFLRGNVQETVANVNFTVELGEYGVKLPWSDRGVGLNVGGEYRKESLKFDTDTAFATGDLAGQGGATIGVEGEFDVRELFGEVQIPIVNDSFLYDFNISAGYRYSDYKVPATTTSEGNSFSTDTYKIAAELAPVRDIRLRASYNRSVRAPNVVELFSAQSVGLAGTEDPCAGDFDPATDATAPSATAAQCALTGVSAGQYGNVPQNPANQYNSFLGGNPNLQPEVADSYTAGLVLQPRFLPGFAATIDYFDIRVKKAIGVIGFDTIINQCIDSGDAFFCDRIQRDAQGSLWVSPNGYIVDVNDNIGSLRTKGVDVQASYAREIGALGTMNASIVGTWLKDLKVNPFGDINYDCAGFFGTQCGTPNPEWRHKLRLGFTLPSGIGISGQWRYFSKVKNDARSSDEDLALSPTSPQFYDENLEIKAQSYFDLTLTAKVQDRFNFRLGANNIFDKDPPIGGNQAIGAPFGNGNTYPQVYDSLGRYLFAGVTVDF